MPAPSDADLRAVHRARLLAVVAGILGAACLGVGRVVLDPASDGAVAALILGAFLLVAAFGLQAWAGMRARTLQAGTGKAAPRGAAQGPPADPRFTTPTGRKGMRLRSWLLFAVAFLFLALAEFQYSERANFPMAVVYGTFGVGALGYALVLRQRLKVAV
jgi:hypothetical protein